MGGSNKANYFFQSPAPVPPEIHNLDPSQGQRVSQVLHLAYEHAPLECLAASVSPHIP